MMPSQQPSRKLIESYDRAGETASNALAPRTMDAYIYWWAQWAEHCRDLGIDIRTAQPVQVATFLNDGALPKDHGGHGWAYATVKLARAALVSCYKGEQIEPNPASDDAIDAVMQGIARTQGTAQKKARAVTKEELTAMVSACPRDAVGDRDALVLLIGFACALRRSDLAALTFEDITRSRVDTGNGWIDGIEVHLRRSKTDQKAEGRSIPVAPTANPMMDPLAALARWRENVTPPSGPLIRAIHRTGVIRNGHVTGRTIRNIIRACAERADLDPDIIDSITGHSLRAGFITNAAERGHGFAQIRQVSGHKSDSVLAGYIRPVDSRRNPAIDTGL